MATIARFLKHAASKSPHRILIDYSTRLPAVRYSSHNFLSTLDEANDSEISISELSIEKRMIKESAIKQNNINFASKTLLREKDDDDDEIPPSSKERRLPGVSQKYKYFTSYCLARKLGQVKSPESLVSTNVKDVRSNDALLKVPMGCLYFNDGKFPGEKAFINWMKAVDFVVENKYSTPLGLSLAVSSLCRLIDYQPADGAKLLSTIGFDRFFSWFQYALEQKDTSSLLYQRSVKKCIHAALLFLKHRNSCSTFRRVEVDYLKGYLNYVLSISIPSKLKALEYIKDDRTKFADFFDQIVILIIDVEINFDQLCSLEEETKENVVDNAIRAFRFHSKLMEESKNLSLVDKTIINRYSDLTCQLFCQWCINNLSFWSDWFDFTLNVNFKYSKQNPVMASKSLQSLLLVLLRANANPNFLRNDADFARKLGEKIKPFFSQYLQENGLRFMTTTESNILMRHMRDCLRSPESPLFALEELEEIKTMLNNCEYE